MRRRDFLLATMAGFSVCPIRPAVALTGQAGANIRENTVQGFPYELLETDGKEALAIWQQLRMEGRGFPVIVGSDDDVRVLTDAFELVGEQAPLEIHIRESLRLAGQLNHPDDIQALRRVEHAENCEYLKQMKHSGKFELGTVTILNPDGSRVELNEAESLDHFLAGCADEYGAELGAWPSSPPASPGLTVATQFQTGEPLETVNIALIPTDDPTTIPAFLQYGGWNECPLPEYHVAALRSWHERYGAEIVGMTGDTINIRVTNRPKTRDEALDLAREQYDYCADIIDQGVGDLSSLAAMLMKSDWWYFW